MKRIDYAKTYHRLGEYSPVLDGVGLLYYGSGRLSSNVYVLEEGRTLVDTGNRDKVVAELLECHPQAEIERVVFTHAHPDHIGGLIQILSLWRPEVIIHSAELECQLPGGMSLHNALHEMGIEKVRSLKGNEDIELSDRSMRVLYTPGHTPGSICLYDPAKRVLFSGDTAFPMAGDEILLPAPDPEGGDLEELVESIRMLLHLEIEAVLPGHLFPFWADVRSHLKRTYFELQIQLQGREDMALINTGIVVADLGDLDGAIRLFDRVLEKAPGHPGACFTKALACYQKGEFQEALDLLDRALQEVPTFREAQQARQMVLIALSGAEGY